MSVYHILLIKTEAETLIYKSIVARNKPKNLAGFLCLFCSEIKHRDRDRDRDR